MPDEATSQQIETPADIGTEGRDVVRRWLTEIKLEEREFGKWRERGEKVVERYRDEKDRKTSKMNILWSNTETLKPALFGATPEPDVRRRFRDQDPVGRYAAMALERTLAFSIDVEGLDGEIDRVVQDYLLPGRGVARVEYRPVISGETVEWESAPVEYWDWRKFRMAPCRKWSQCRWVCWDHDMTRQDLIDNFGGEIGKAVTLRDMPESEGEDESGNEMFQTAVVHEIWDKDSRQVLFISPGYAEAPLEVRDDPLKLTGFFNTPEPLDVVRTNGSMVPIPEYTLYQDQAEELDEITGRIDRIVSALRVRGVYNAAMSSVSQLMAADDNDLIAQEDWTQFVQGGGVEGNIEWMPIEALAKALLGLYQQRAQLLDLIYQITGISDVMRGASDSNETATAQRLKGQFGTFRLQPKQRAVQAYVRDLLRLKAEIVAEQFSADSIREMSGIKLPTVQEKMQAQTIAQSAQQTGQEVPPEVMEALSKPTWLDVKAVLESDAQRSFRVDIETDSTIAPDAIAEKQAVNEFLTATGAYMSQAGPLIETGVLPPDLARTIYLWAARKYKVSREIEDQLEGGQDGPLGLQRPQQEGPSAEEIAAQQEAQLEQAKMQQEAREAAAKLQFEQQKHAEEMAFKREELAAELAFKREQAVLDRQAQMSVEDAKIRGQIGLKHMDLSGDPEGVNLRALVDQQEVEMREVAQSIAQLAQVVSQSTQQTNDVVTALIEQQRANQEQMQALFTAMIQAQTAPKRLVTDSRGNPVGVETDFGGDDRVVN